MSRRTRWAKAQHGVKTSVTEQARRITIDDLLVDVNFADETLVISTKSGLRLAAIDFATIIRRELALQAPADGQARAFLDRIPEIGARLRLQVAAVFTPAETLGISVEGSFPELVVRRIADPVRRAIEELTQPQKGRIILP